MLPLTQTHSRCGGSGDLRCLSGLALGGKARTATQGLCLALVLSVALSGLWFPLVTTRRL